MAIPHRTPNHGTFFITSATWNRRRLFQTETTARLLLETLQHYRREGHYKLQAFVIMPDHIHLLLTPQETTLERAVQLIKGGFSRRLESNIPVWQRGFTDRRMRDRDDFLTSRAPGRATARGSDVPITDLAREIGFRLQRSVADQTNLPGNYDFFLHWNPDTDTPAGDSTEPSLATALHEQLGLKLIPTRGPVQVLIIDKAEKPTEN